MIAGLPVLSNKLGLIQGCVTGESGSISHVVGCRVSETLITHLNDEPPPEVDAAHSSRTVGKWRRKGASGVPRPMRLSRRECDKKGHKEERDKHRRQWEWNGAAKQTMGKK
jgi:hypothetical protein